MTPTLGKHWRLTYVTTLSASVSGNKRRHTSSWVFLTVAEALEHARLNDITKFRLEDLKTKVH